MTNTSESISKGMHYKGYVIQQKDVGQPLDPAFIAAAMAESGNPLSGMQFTVLKKDLRMGRGDKSKEQDLKDIIGAAERELSLSHHRESKPSLIDALDNAYASGVDLLNSMNEPGCNDQAMLFELIDEITDNDCQQCNGDRQEKKGVIAEITEILITLTPDLTPSKKLQADIEQIALQAFDEMAEVKTGVHPNRIFRADHDAVYDIIDVVNGFLGELEEGVPFKSKLIIAENAVGRATEEIRKFKSEQWRQLQSAIEEVDNHRKHMCTTCTRRDLRHACSLSFRQGFESFDSTDVIKCTGYNKVKHA